MGLPISHLCASVNENDVVHRFISYGELTSLDFVQPTFSSAMDLSVCLCSILCFGTNVWETSCKFVNLEANLLSGRQIIPFIVILLLLFINWAFFHLIGSRQASQTFSHCPTTTKVLLNARNRSKNLMFGTVKFYWALLSILLSQNDDHPEVGCVCGGDKFVSFVVAGAHSLPWPEDGVESDVHRPSVSLIFRIFCQNWKTFLGTNLQLASVQDFLHIKFGSNVSLNVFQMNEISLKHD